MTPEAGADLDRVAPRLLVGGLSAAADAPALRALGVSAILSLTHADPDGGYPDGITVHAVPMVDGPQNDLEAFEQAVSVATAALRADGTLLVHCAAGSSRSVAVAATALALVEPLDLDEAFRRVADRRDPADPHEALVDRAAAVYLARR